MYKNQRIIDADTHVYEPAELLEKNLDPEYRNRIEELRSQVVAITPAIKGKVYYCLGRKSFWRPLGVATAAERGATPQIMVPAFKGRTPTEDTNADAHERIKDMDYEGVDTAVMFPTGIASMCAMSDVGWELAMYRAYHRYINDFCAPYPDRLKSVLLVSSRDIKASIEELRRWGNAAWPVAIFPVVSDKPIDHPDLDPLWATAQELDLAIALHTFSTMPPYAPGIFDMWDNGYLVRCQAHPAFAMRNTGAIIGAGILDRFPRLRLGVLEAGFGWLPFWMQRLNEHTHGFPDMLPYMKKTPKEHITGPQYFHTIEVNEGDAAANYVASVVGEETLMYASDYPHNESWFPKTVEAVDSWNLSTAAKEKLFFGNAAKFYGRITG